MAASAALLCGEPFPLTATRYAPVSASPTLQTNGRDFFRFWPVRDGVRVAKQLEGEPRGSRYVFDTRAEGDASVTWTGTHFFVVARDQGSLIGRLLDANAEPVGTTFPLVRSPTPVVVSFPERRSVR